MFLFMRFFNKKRNAQSSAANRPKELNIDSRPLHREITQNIEEIKRLFPASPDLAVYRFFAGPQEIPAVLVYLDGLTDKNSINNNVLRPLMNQAPEGNDRIPVPTISGVRHVTVWGDVEQAVLSGESVLFIEGDQVARVYDTQGWPQRAIEDPQLESSLKGAHQGFVETGMQNIALIRRYVPNRELRIAEHSVGRRGKSKIWIMYLQDVAHPEVLQELQDRIRQLDIDAIVNTGELAELIEDNSFSPFPQFILTERPDTAVSQLLQGRYVVVVDRSPSVIVAPAAFISFFQSVDDYNSRWLIGSFLRLLRFVAFTIAVFLPAVYIAFISFNHEVIPLELFLSIAESRERVPLPPLLEALLMEIMLEMIREAGIRLPAPIGQSIGMVGGIIVGQAAVQAHIVSNIMVIVVASTAIASFTIPNYDMGTAIRLLRFPMMLIASLFGIIGIVVGLMMLIAHLVSLESLGTPYGSPLAPFRWADMKDTFVRLPLWSMFKRPKSARPVQFIRKEPDDPKGGAP
ncbi:spore germination protein [Paenibacillus sp. GD4]|jgi:spore germination protein|uniref:spore germination protein n=1 Tax=Paenibacillus sp. GD4 TaxID=3068890 RepID=UPI002796D44C|nr:spore germination protein [Paenibacillus sp. GD4]MDQ1914889.1 spore germination protein [Paenibacillus sp. GD4]